MFKAYCGNVVSLPLEEYLAALEEYLTACRPHQVRNRVSLSF